MDFYDYARTDAGFNSGSNGWLNGDFDGNGVIDFDDLVLLPAQLFRERLPGRPVPAERAAMLAALAETVASPGLAPALAARRLETLRALFKEAGIARARLVETPLAERPDAAGGTIDLTVLEPDGPRRSLLQKLRGLGGTVIGE